MCWIKDCLTHIGMEYEGLLLLGDIGYQNRTNLDFIKKTKEKCVKYAEKIVEKIKEISSKNNYD